VPLSPCRTLASFTKREAELMSSPRLGFRALVRDFNFGIRCRESDVLSNTVGNEMTYRISYDDGLAAMVGAQGHDGVTRTEYFRTEYEALQRARQLLQDGDHHAVSLSDSSGSVLAGIRLQLKLGASIAD
jgi:hypothetical protein